MAKKLLGRDAIVAAEDRAFEDVDVPEWDGAVRIMAMTAAEQDAYIAWLVETSDDQKEVGTRGPKLVAACLVDEAGKRLFTAEQIAELGAKSGPVLNRLWAICQRLCKMRPQDAEDLEKN